MEHVILKGKEFKIVKGELKLISKDIKEISEIEGLKELTTLKRLNIGGN